MLKTKLNFSTSHCPDISYPKYLGQRPHELLGQLFKEQWERLRSLIKVAYSTVNRDLVNRFKKKFDNRNSQCFQTVVFRFLPRRTGVTLEREAYSTAPRLTVNGAQATFCQRLRITIRKSFLPDQQIGQLSLGPPQ